MAAGNVRMLVAGLRTARPDAATRAAFAPLVASLQELAAPLPPEAIDARRAVLGDHANSRAMLRELFDSPTRPTDPTGVASLWLTHEAATLTAIDARYAEFIAWLDAPDHATRPPPRAHKHAEGFGWWLWNPGGKLALDLLDLDLGDIVRNIESGRARSRRLRRARGGAVRDPRGVRAGRRRRGAARDRDGAGRPGRAGRRERSGLRRALSAASGASR
jgi:hypothetical protein